MPDEDKIELECIAERIVYDETGAVIAKYKPGQVVAFSESSADRWLRRGVFREIEGSVKQTRRGARKVGPADAPPGEAKRKKGRTEKKPAPDPE